MGALRLDQHSICGYGCKSKVYLLHQLRPDIMVSISRVQSLKLLGNQIPYGLPLFEIDLEALSEECQEYCEFYELSQAHWFPGRVELGSKLQKRHSQFPSNPFCDYSIRL